MNREFGFQRTRPGSIKLMIDSDDFRALLRNHAGAVAVIAVSGASGRTGLTATAVCSLTDKPPMVLACVNKTASAHEPIGETKAFSVNLLATDQTDVATVFSGQTDRHGEARFDDAQWMTLATGAPVLKSAMAALDCRLVERHDYSTHTIFIGSVEDGRRRDDGQPLVYFQGAFRALDR